MQIIDKVNVRVNVSVDVYCNLTKRAELFYKVYQQRAT